MKFPSNYIITRKTVRNACIRITPDKEIFVSVPIKYSDSDIVKLINDKQGWINKTLIKFDSIQDKINLKPSQLLLFGKKFNYKYNAALKFKVTVDFDNEVIDSDFNLNNKKIQAEWYKIIATDYLEKRVNKLANDNNFSYNKITVRSQKTRWGSCSYKKHLSFNWKLMKAPHFVIDYIIFHELAHTKHLNHSKTFWKAVEMVCPDYQKAEDWLKKYGNNL